MDKSNIVKDFSQIELGGFDGELSGKEEIIDRPLMINELIERNDYFIVRATTLDDKQDVDFLAGGILGKIFERHKHLLPFTAKVVKQISSNQKSYYCLAGIKEKNK